MGLCPRRPSPAGRSASRRGRDRGPGKGRKERAAPARPACPPRRTGAWCGRSSSRCRHTREFRRRRPAEKPGPDWPAAVSLRPEAARYLVPGPQKCDQQGSNRRPAQKIQIGQGKNQNLQAGRQQHQQPRASVHSPHQASITNIGRRASGVRRQPSDLGRQTSDFRPWTSGPWNLPAAGLTIQVQALHLRSLRF